MFGRLEDYPPEERAAVAAANNRLAEVIANAPKAPSAREAEARAEYMGEALRSLGRRRTRAQEGPSDA